VEWGLRAHLAKGEPVHESDMGRRRDLKVAYHTLLHILGVGCIAACIAIVATMGALDIHWSGWVAVAFFAMLALGILIGWFPWRGKPMRVMLKGFYAMSALALLGFGFTLSDPMRPPLWMVLGPVALAMVARLAINIVMRARAGEKAEPPRRSASGGIDDPLF
jgi:hypothetical protein